MAGFAGGEIQSNALNHALVKKHSIVGLHWALDQQRDPEPVAACHRDLTAPAARGVLRPLASERLPLDELADGDQSLADDVTVGREAHVRETH